MKSSLCGLYRLDAAAAILLIAVVCCLADRPAEGDSRRPRRPHGVVESHIPASGLRMLGNNLPDWVAGHECLEVNEEGHPAAFGRANLSGMSYFIEATGTLMMNVPEYPDNGNGPVSRYFPLRYDEDRKRLWPSKSGEALGPFDWDFPPVSKPVARFLLCFPEETQVKAPVRVAISWNADNVWVDSNAFPGFYLTGTEVVDWQKGPSFLLTFRRLPGSRKLTFYLGKIPEGLQATSIELWCSTSEERHKEEVFHLLRREPWDFSLQDSIKISVDVHSSVLPPPPTRSGGWGDQTGCIVEELRVEDEPDSASSLEVVRLKNIRSFLVAVYKSRESCPQNDGTDAFVRWDYETRRRNQYSYQLKSSVLRVWPAIWITPSVPPELLAERNWEVCAIPKGEERDTSEWRLIGTIKPPHSFSKPMRFIPKPMKGERALDAGQYDYIGLRIAGNCPGFRGRLDGQNARIDLSDATRRQPIEVLSAIDRAPISDVVVRPPAVGSSARKAGVLDLVFLQDPSEDEKCWPARPVTVSRPGYHDVSFDPEQTSRVTLEPLDSTCEVQVWLEADSSGVPLAGEGLQMAFQEPLRGWGGAEPPRGVEHGRIVNAPGGIAVNLSLSGAAKDVYQIDQVRGLKVTEDPEHPYTWPLADSANGGRVAIILTGKPVTARIEYRFDFEREESSAPPLEFQQLRAGGDTCATEIESVQDSLQGGTVMIGGVLTTTKALIVRMDQTPELEGIEPSAIETTVNADGELVASNAAPLVLRRRSPAVVVLVDASREMGAVWTDVRDALFSLVEESESLPPKLRIALGQDMLYESMKAVPEEEGLLENYRVGPVSNPRPDRHLRRAELDVMTLNPDVSTLHNRIVYIIPNDPLLYRPWNPERSLYDKSKVDLYVVEVGFPNSASRNPTPFAEAFFDSTVARKYAFVRTVDELRSKMLSFVRGGE